MIECNFLSFFFRPPSAYPYSYLIFQPTSSFSIDGGLHKDKVSEGTEEKKRKVVVWFLSYELTDEGWSDSRILWIYLTCPPGKDPLDKLVKRRHNLEGDGMNPLSLTVKVGRSD